MWGCTDFNYPVSPCHNRNFNWFFTNFAGIFVKMYFVPEIYKSQLIREINDVEMPKSYLSRKDRD